MLTSQPVRGLGLKGPQLGESLSSHSREKMPQLHPPHSSDSQQKLTSQLYSPKLLAEYVLSQLSRDLCVRGPTS